MKRIFFTVLHKFQLTRLAAWWNRKRVIILCYHGVTERLNRHPNDPAGLHIRADRFEAQLDHLRRHYRVISLTEFLEARRTNTPLPRKSVVLTFDDGYRNFLTGALPRLAAREMPASVFLITDRIPAESHAGRNGWSELDGDCDDLVFLKNFDRPLRPAVTVGDKQDRVTAFARLANLGNPVADTPVELHRGLAT